MMRFCLRQSMSDLGRLRKEIDVESTKIKLAILKFEVRVEMLQLPKKEMETLVSTLRKIYISVHEKLQAATRLDNRFDFDSKKLRKAWIQNWSEAKAILERLEEIVEDIERSAPVEDEDRMNFYLEAIREVLVNPPQIFFGSYNDEVPSSRSMSIISSCISDTDTVFSAEDEKPWVAEYQLTSGSSRRLPNRPVRIESGDYSLQSDLFHTTSSESHYSSKESIVFTS
ncbi:uncharacterized protein LOC106665710 [Cimex lectularius]|uniref:Uncharacterized protein n=1 Tax=Cimex lectularius TaxID=79782 RepID=A0A8I6RPQ9_CIMLE|nr:uncharacterized protein LOC106665710 [Cimex lectularius]XP_014247849.1 uncharacterized protein LOC106665710 [Cimex lectularius]